MDKHADTQTVQFLNISSSCLSTCMVHTAVRSAWVFVLGINFCSPVIAPVSGSSGLPQHLCLLHCVQDQDLQSLLPRPQALH